MSHAVSSLSSSAVDGNTFGSFHARHAEELELLVSNTQQMFDCSEVCAADRYSLRDSKSGEDILDLLISLLDLIFAYIPKISIKLLKVSKRVSI